MSTEARAVFIKEQLDSIGLIILFIAVAAIVSFSLFSFSPRAAQAFCATPVLSNLWPFNAYAYEFMLKSGVPAEPACTFVATRSGMVAVLAAFITIKSYMRGQKGKSPLNIKQFGVFVLLACIFMIISIDRLSINQIKYGMNVFDHLSINILKSAATMLLLFSAISPILDTIFYRLFHLRKTESS